VPPVATVVSYRLGGSDGVSVEAAKWIRALRVLGFEIRRVAGEMAGPRHEGDIVLPEIAIGAAGAPPIAAPEIAAAIDGSDLVVAENICSLPLNLTAASAVADALQAQTGRVVMHHHDLPWQRRGLAEHEQAFPPRPDGALHVTVNLRSRNDLEARGYREVAVIHNRFDFDAPPGNRAATREQLGFARDDVVVLQPARAIERKNVPGGVLFAGALSECLADSTVRYWLSGPAEDGYGPTLDRVLARSTVDVTVGRAPSAADAYAAADAIVFPSTWEGFGNPTIESIVARRPLAVFRYPVLAEIAAHGLQFFDLDEAADVARFVQSPDRARLDANVRRARAAFSLADLPTAITEVFEMHGWWSW